jgi:hypothetical protein
MSAAPWKNHESNARVEQKAHLQKKLTTRVAHGGRGHSFET